MRENNLIKKLWLNCVCKHEPDVINRYIRAFESAEAVYEADAAKLREFGFGRAAMNKNLDEAERIYRECLEKDIHIITIDDENYPNQLRNVNYAPRILYVRGRLPDMRNLLGVGIVGTRYPSEDGCRMAYAIAKELASCGIIIVSGMAKGIDKMAHIGALHAGNKTIALLAGGVDVIYPPRHKDLYASIIENGAVISERPPGYPAESRLYVQRNRILVGLCSGIVIAEGKFRSGTSMSARLATENNRDVFAVPASPLNPNSELPNSLISDGATVANGAKDILQHYLYTYPELINNGARLVGQPVNFPLHDMDTAESSGVSKRKEHQIEPESISKIDIDKVISQLGDEKQAAAAKYLFENGASQIDSISSACGLSAGNTSAALLMLEMKGIVKRNAGNIYSPVLK